MSLPVQRKIPFLFVGNQPCLDFINTDLVINGQPTDLLASFLDLVAWLVQAGLITEDAAKRIGRGGVRHGSETLKQVKEFRATMRDMAQRLAEGQSVPHTALDAINHLLRHRLGYPQISRRSDAFERTYQAGLDDSNEVLGLLAEAASDLLVTCDLALIKQCQNPECVLFFYDTTKNHARHWCSMSLCGNRSKVAAHYHRHRNKGHEEDSSHRGRR
jgi:predicted RNA-binding Zn ribbon-like protein